MKKPKSKIFIELQGQVFFVETQGKKTISKVKMDSKTVLQLLAYCVTEALKAL